MDLGFGAVLEKFEEYFGRRATKLLLVLIGLAVAAVSVGAIFRWIVSPILTAIQSPQWGQTIASIIIAAVGIGGGVAVGFNLIAGLAHWRRLRQTTKLRVEAGELVSKAKSIMGEVVASQNRTHALLEVAMIAARDHVEKSEALSEVQRTEALEKLTLVRQLLEPIEKEQESDPS